MENLTSMTAFVLEQRETSTHETKQHEWYFKEVVKLDKIRNYANFLKQPLELGMFVPCDEDGNVVEKPEENDLNGSFLKMQINYNKEVKWEFAKERCLFEGFELIIKPNGNRYIQKNETIIFYNTENDNGVWRVNRKFISIEDLVKYNLKLTPTAQKQLGL